MDTLVSIMIPCFNGEKHIGILFDSIILQTYRNIEVVFVNDGSTDNTEQIVLSYREKFDKCGIKFVYKYQKNKGQAAAINTALKYIHGKYIMWIDADDYMQINHIEKKVTYLEQHPNISIVMCQGTIIEENYNGKEKGKLGEENPIGSLFEDILLEFRRCTPGLYMVRKDILFKAIPNKKILESHVGQNMQLLLPMTYIAEIGYLNDALFYYVERQESHSHRFKTLSDLYTRILDVYNLKIEILQSMKDLISLEYMLFLKNELQLKLILDLIKLISQVEYSIVDDNKVLSEIVNKIIHSDYINFNLEKEIFIWGACKKNYRLKSILEYYSNIKIAGFIESKEKETLFYTISPTEIDSSKMYLFIPLEIHSDILDVLREKHFEKNNICYLKYDVVHRLEKYSNVNRRI